MQQSKLEIHQQHVVNDQDEELKSKVPVSKVTKESEFDDIKILAEIKSINGNSFSVNVVEGDQGNKKIYPNLLVSEEQSQELVVIKDKMRSSVGEEGDEYRHEYLQEEKGRYDKNCEQHGDIYEPIGYDLSCFLTIRPVYLF